MLVDRNLDAAEETQRLIADEGGESFAFRADVSRSDGCRAMADACIERYGRSTSSTTTSPSRATREVRSRSARSHGRRCSR